MAGERELLRAIEIIEGDVRYGKIQHIPNHKMISPCPRCALDDALLAAHGNDCMLPARGWLSPIGAEMLRAQLARMAGNPEQLEARREREEQLEQDLAAARAQVVALTDETEERADTIMQLRAEAERPKCFYCSFGETGPPESSAALQHHIEHDCQRHPIHDLTADLKTAMDVAWDVEQGYGAAIQRAELAEARIVELEAAQERLIVDAMHHARRHAEQLEEDLAEARRYCNGWVDDWREAIQRTEQAEARVEALREELEVQESLWGLVANDLRAIDMAKLRVPFMEAHDPIGRITKLLTLTPEPPQETPQCE